MSLLTIANAVADETKGPRPSTIVGNTDPAAQNMLRLINKVGYRLMLTYPWSILRIEQTITAPGTETLVAAASMPTNFNRFIPETMWDRSSNNLVSGPISPVEWNGLKVQTFSSQNKKFIYRGGAILTAPTFASGTTVAYEYIADTWADVAATGSPKSSMTLDTDVSRIDTELVIAATTYSWLNAEGQPDAAAFKNFKDMFDFATQADAGNVPIMVSGDIFAQNSRHFDGAPKASRASYGGDF